jgi:hypothetical protein
MSKATAAITSKLKNTYVRIGYGPDAELQKALFTMGFTWARWKSGVTRDINDSARTYISIHPDGQLMHSSDPHATPNQYIEAGDTPFKEVTREYVMEAAAEVKAIKRRENKESKKCRAKRKWDATARKNCFVGCPVRKDEIVSVKFASGEVHTANAGVWNWANDIGSSTIVSYKVHARNTHKPKPVTVEGEWIKWTGGSCPVKAEDYVQIKFRAGFNSNVASQNTDKCYWEHKGNGGDIVAYRIQPESERVTKTVTQEEMVDALADSIGKPLAIPVESTSERFMSMCAEIDAKAPDTNPKKQYGVQSVPLNMWSPLASAYGALGLYNGSLKYGKANFANTPVEASIYIAAAMRHLNAWAAGEEFDPADGVPNLGGVLANIAILLEARAAGMLIDDRLKMSGYLKERDALKDIVKSLNELHAGKNPKHYTLDQK